MAFQLSVGIDVVEKDLTNIIPAVSTSAGAFVGTFQWGPVNDIRVIGSEQQLVATFGKPNAFTATSFLSAANFLSYGNNLKVARAVGTSARNAVTSGTAVVVKNRTDWDTNYALGQANVGTFAARCPGTLGNSITVSIADSATWSGWAYKGLFNSVPGTSAYVTARGGSNDECHIVVIDSQGLWTGTAGTVLETYAYVSKAVDARRDDGTNSYYRMVLANSSKYIWNMAHPTGMSNWGSNAQGITFSSLSSPETDVLTGGVSSDDVTSASLTTAWDLFTNPNNVDISLVFVGEAPLNTATYVMQNIVQTRKDCLGFLSPARASVINNVGSEQTSVIADKGVLGLDSSYCEMDCNWKYQYDKYNDVYRWVPLNADIAGLCARTDSTNDPWWSPGGMTRGQIKGVVKLAWNPTQTDRDELYKVGINPVISVVGSGTVLWGDKTLQSKPSAFDRINVRRLFIVLEKAIALAAKYELFEFNDVFTRAQFRAMVEPFLRDVQGRRGIYDFKVVCDDTNNTGEVIDSNRFIGDIYIKPARSINYITLNFVAVRTSVKFEEIVGK